MSRVPLRPLPLFDVPGKLGECPVEPFLVGVVGLPFMDCLVTVGCLLVSRLVALALKVVGLVVRGEGVGWVGGAGKWRGDL